MSNTRSTIAAPTVKGSKPIPPVLAIQLDMAAPTPRPSPRQFALNVSLLSPPIDGPTPTSSKHQQPILASEFSPSSRKTAPRPLSAPPTITTFEPDSAPQSPEQERPQTAIQLHPPHGLPTPRRPLSRRTSNRYIAPGGELLPPPPPLLRPTTFWRNTRRSGVTGSSYSPGSHLVRRSSFIAAGLALDRPGLDLSAFGVESRAVHLVLPPDSKLVISGSHE